MSRQVVRKGSLESVRERAIDLVALAFEGEGEAWSDTESGDRLARIAVDTLLDNHMLKEKQ